MSKKIHTKVCIVGGGPAGMMTGLLLARIGIDVTVLEKHKDFFRDFRGDTIHPSTMEVLHQLGLLDKFLKLPHQKSSKLAGNINGKEFVLADFSHLKVKSPYIAFIPQWDFLNFIAKEAKKYPSFNLRMQTEATDIVKEDSKVIGVKTKEKMQINADLVIAADGRNSIMRKQAGLKSKSYKVPIDILWFRLPKKKSSIGYTLGFIQAGNFLVMIERDTYWQCGFAIQKGKFDQMKRNSIKKFQKDIQDLAGLEEEVVAQLKNWNDIKPLSITLDRLKKWYLPGFLAIGDAAHAMSPIGGVGINLAIQDAVAAARILTPEIQKGVITVSTLKKIQTRRQLPTRIVQELQNTLHKRVVLPVLKAEKMENLPPIFRLLQTFPTLRRIPAHIIGIGVRPEYID